MAKWKILKANQEAERAQLNKILAEIELSQDGHEQKLSQTLNRTATLSTVIDDPNSGMRALSDAYRNTYARVYELDGSVVALAQDITVLQARVDDIETGESGNAEAIQQLTTRVEANEDGIVANAGFITNLEASVYDPVTGLAATAGALESLEVEVDGINDTVMASYTLTLDANGYITGWKFTNDGTTGLVDFRADRFRITAPGSIKSVEFADGILMSVTPTHAYYQGVDFGVSNNLITWYGAVPASGPAGATTSNGLFWIKNDGSGYFGGGLSNTVVTNLPIIVNHESRIDTLETSVTDPTTGLTALAQAQSALEVRVEDTEDGLTAQASDITGIKSSLNDKMVIPNPSFELGSVGWANDVSGVGALPEGVTVDDSPGSAYSGTKYLRFSASPYTRTVYSEANIPVRGGSTLRMRMRSQTINPPPVGAEIRFGVRQMDSSGNYVANSYVPWPVGDGTTWSYNSPRGLSEGQITLQSATRFVRPFLYCTGLTSNNIVVDSVEMDSLSLTGEVLATALQETQTTVSQQGTTISGHTSQLSSLNTAIAGKASTTAVNLLEGRVEDTESGLSAQASQIATLSSSVGANSASVSMLSTAVVRGAGNVLQNAGFETGDTSGWSRSGSGSTDRIYVVAGDPYSGNYDCRFNGDASGANISLISDVRVPYVPGKTYRFGAYVQRAGSNPDGAMYMCLRAYDANGNYHSTNHGQFQVATPPYTHDRREGSFTAPTSASTIAYLAMQIYTNNHTTGSWTVDDAFLEPLSSTEETAYASVTMALDVNGYITGYKFQNDGTTGTMAIRADKFSIVSPGGGARTEYSNGNWRVYDAAGTLRVRMGVW